MFSFVLSEKKSILSCQLLCLHPHRAEALINAFVWRLSVWHLSVSLSVTFCYNLRSPPSCVLALTLLVAINYVLGHLTWHVRVTISRHNFSDVAYTVDAAIFLSDESQATETSIHSALPLLRWVSGYLGPRPNLRICYKQSVSHSYHGPCDCWCCEGIHIPQQQPMLRWLLSSWPATRGRNDPTVQLAAIENKQETSLRINNQ